MQVVSANYGSDTALVNSSHLQGCFDWRSPTDLLISIINCGDSANGSGVGTRYNWVVVRAHKIEDSDHRSWPGSSTAERVLPGGATTGLHFDIGPMAVIPQTTATGLVIGGLTSGRQRTRSYFWPTTEFVSFQIWQFCSQKRDF
jgi:hypothetical protein